MTSATTTEGYAFEARGVSKTYGSQRVLSEAGLQVRRRSIHALLGANGSGKSTLVKCLAGVVRADPGGEIRARGSVVAAGAMTPAWAQQLGMRFVHQNPGFFPEMTVAENLVTGAGHSTPALYRRSRVDRTAAAVLEAFGIDVAPTALMGDLRLADQTMVAIARALSRGAAETDGPGPGSVEAGTASLLVLDEPTAALPDGEVEVLFGFLRRALERDLSVVYISHRLDEVREICDDVTVLRDGMVAATEHLDDLSDSLLVTHIVGRSLDRLYPEAVAVPAQSVVARATSLWGDGLRDVSVEVHAREIVGIAGLAEGGQTELLRSFFGSHALTGGTLELDGARVAPTSPAGAMRLGVAYVPQHRNVEAVFPDLSVAQNYTAASLSAVATKGFLNRRAEERAAARAIADYGIKTDGTQAAITSLSGGNQQKVIVARWVSRSPKLLLLDEPTQGVDVGARSDVYALIRAAAARGAGVLIASSDFDELAEMCDRVVMIHAGTTGRVLTRQELSSSVLTHLAFSPSADAEPRPGG